MLFTPYVVSTSAQGFPGSPGFPQDGRHYKCSLVQADGQYQLEKKQNRGDPGDLFRPGQIFGPSNDPNLGPFPNSDSYQAGNLAQTGIIIHVGDFFVDTSTSGSGILQNRRRNLQSSFNFSCMISLVRSFSSVFAKPFSALSYFLYMPTGL